MARPRKVLSVEDVLAIHADTIRHEGGVAGIRDHGLLESAVMMPRQQFGGAYLHRTLADQAAAYLFHLCRNHPFNDGSERVGVLSALVFLDANGVGQLPEPGPLETLTMQCAAGEIGKSEVAAFFGKRLRAAATPRRRTEDPRRTRSGRRK